LGVPGLINAYKTVSALVLQTVPIVQKPIMLAYFIQFDYNLLNDVMQVLKQCQCVVKSQEIDLFSGIKFHIPKHREDETVFRLKEIRNAELSKLL